MKIPILDDFIIILLDIKERNNTCLVQSLLENKEINEHFLLHLMRLTPPDNKMKKEKENMRK